MTFLFHVKISNKLKIIIKGLFNICNHFVNTHVFSYSLKRLQNRPLHFIFQKKKLTEDNFPSYQKFESRESKRIISPYYTCSTLNERERERDFNVFFNTIIFT